MYKCNVCGNKDDFKEIREGATIYFRRNRVTNRPEISGIEFCISTDVVVED